MRDRAVMLVVFGIVWMLLWGDISLANFLGGMAVGGIVLLFTPDSSIPELHRLRPVGLIRFMIRFVIDLVVASITVVRQVFWPIGRLQPRVVKVSLNTRDKTVLAVVANTITLTPGTLTLDVDATTGTLWVHALHVEDDGTSVVEAGKLYQRLAAAMLCVEEAIS